MPRNKLDAVGSLLEVYNKSDLVDDLSEFVLLPKSEVKGVVDFIFHMILKKVKEGKRVKLSRFGSFFGYEKSARKGRNPNTNEEVQIPTRTILRFSPTLYTRGFLNRDIKENIMNLKTKDFTWRKEKEMDEFEEYVFYNPFRDYEEMSNVKI